jgi:CxxC motif-containing protein
LIMEPKRTKKFICIVCPKCCELETDGEEVKGAKCKRGKEFALQEAIAPLRFITTTVRYETNEGRKMIPVKSADPLPREDIPQIMRHIKGVRISEIPALGSRIHVRGYRKPIELIVTGE